MGYILDPRLGTGLKPMTKHPKIPNHCFRNLLKRIDIGHKIKNYVMQCNKMLCSCTLKINETPIIRQAHTLNIDKEN